MYLSFLIEHLVRTQRFYERVFQFIKNLIIISMILSFQLCTFISKCRQFDHIEFGTDMLNRDVNDRRRRRRRESVTRWCLRSGFVTPGVPRETVRSLLFSPAQSTGARARVQVERL